MPLMKTTHGWHKGDFSTIILPLLHLAYAFDNFHVSTKVVSIKEYNLDVIIAIGYQVNLVLGTKFRIWATKSFDNFKIEQIVRNYLNISPLRVIAILALSFCHFCISLMLLIIFMYQLRLFLFIIDNRY
jgi:hypothetical protein